MSCIDLLLVILIIVCLIVFWNKYAYPDTHPTTLAKEGMAPLGWGSFPNPYPRGECLTGSMERQPCEVGNCNLGTNISHERYCGIVHAQDSDPVTRHENIARCIYEMQDGYCD